MQCQNTTHTFLGSSGTFARSRYINEVIISDCTYKTITSITTNYFDSTHNNVKAFFLALNS